MLPFPSTGPMPLVQTPPAGHPQAAAHLHRQQFPGNAGAQHKQDTRQRRAVVQARPAAFRLGRLRRDQRLDDRPQGVGNKGNCHREQGAAIPLPTAPRRCCYALKGGACIALHEPLSATSAGFIPQPKTMMTNRLEMDMLHPHGSSELTG